MSAFLRTMYWSLDYTCLMRSATQPTDPEQVRDLLHEVTALSRGENQDGICITASTFNRDDPNTVWFPTGGFRIKDQFAAIGGRMAVQENCFNCAANARRSNNELAGCAGMISFEPHIKQQQDSTLLQEIITTGMHEAYHRLFIPTQPVWYSFWIHSPLSVEQCEFLLTLFERFIQRKIELKLKGKHNNIKEFMQAARISVQHHIPLHVKMMPDSDATPDKGGEFYDHCPRCKATAESASESQQAVCRVCGLEYDPAEVVREWQRPARTSLIELLGKEGWAEFARKRAKHQWNVTPEKIEQALEIWLKQINL